MVRAVLSVRDGIVHNNIVGIGIKKVLGFGNESVLGVGDIRMDIRVILVILAKCRVGVIVVAGEGGVGCSMRRCCN